MSSMVMDRLGEQRPNYSRSLVSVVFRSHMRVTYSYPSGLVNELYRRQK